MPIKARNYITVYKVVRRRKNKTGLKKYQTPCTKTGIKLFERIIAIGHKLSKSKYYLHNPSGAISSNARPGQNTIVYSVEDGYIHTCTTKDAAKDWIKKNYHLFPHNKKQPFHWGIIKCIIEPGTLYYKSYDGTQICARYLITREMVLKG